MLLKGQPLDRWTGAETAPDPAGGCAPPDALNLLKFAVCSCQDQDVRSYTALERLQVMKSSGSTILSDTRTEAAASR